MNTVPSPEWNQRLRIDEYRAHDGLEVRPADSAGYASWQRTAIAERER
jgi:hypothetical protein